ncbi:MAG: RNA polymerase sigma-70 factor [Bacteroidales bacterium]|nr:RNA polymerase sigma-70 factor [Bacteroidales bacterium]
MNEDELIKQLQQGDEAAFEFIFRQHFTGLCLFAEHFLKDTAAAEEIVEDFFCHLWETGKYISINTSLRGFLYKSIYNQCLKYVRHKKVEDKYREEQYYFNDREILEGASADYPSVNLVVKELEAKISEVIDSLPEQCRKIFCMNRYENKTYQEIADKLGISINTVKTQMARALQKLRNELAEYLALIALILSAV